MSPSQAGEDSVGLCPHDRGTWQTSHFQCGEESMMMRVMQDLWETRGGTLNPRRLPGGG